MCVAFFFISIFTLIPWGCPLNVVTLNIVGLSS